MPGENPFDQFDEQRKLPEVMPRNAFDAFDVPEREAPAAPERPLSRNPLRWMKGAGETALGVGTAMGATPINEFIASGAAFLEGGRDADSVIENPPVGSYVPKSPEGQAISRWLGTVMAPVGKAIEFAADPTMKGEDPVGEHFLKGVFGVLPVKAPIARMMRKKPKAPTIDELRLSSRAAYQAAERGSGVVAQSSLGKVTNKIEQMLADEGVDATLHPATMAGLNRLYEGATRPGIAGHSLKGLDVIRKVLGAAENAAKAGSDDARLAAKMLDEFDDFVDGLSPADLVGGMGDAHLAARNYAQARQMWSRMRKAQTIENLFERASNAAGGYTQSGMENALRIQFKQLADNPRRFNRFNVEEKAAILEVVRGGPLQNTLRWAGKLSPRGIVSATGTALLGDAIAGPVGAFGLAGLGATAGGAAERMRLGAANRVSELVRRGPQPPAVQSTGRRLPQLGYLPPAALAAPQLQPER